MVCALLGQAGCGDCATRIVAEEPSSKELVRATLEEFREAVDRPDDICVPKIKIGEGFWGEGRYNTVSRNIRVAAQPSDEVTRTYLRHELCHAADFQLDLKSHRSAAVEDSAGGRISRRELFAEACGSGPDSYTLLSAACPDDPPATRAMATLLGAVYARVERRQILSADTIATTLVGNDASIAVAYSNGFDLFAGTTEGRFGITPAGEEAHVSLPPIPPLDPSPYAGAVPPGWSVEQGQSLSDSDVALVTIRLPNGGTARRVLVNDAVGCPLDGEHLVTTGMEVYGVAMNEGTLIWRWWHE